ncbi:MAG: tyrosine-type recombinase/integrase [Faecousia sp.]
MHRLEKHNIPAYGRYLYEQERSCATVEKYLRSLERFYAWLPEDKSVDKVTVIAYKETLSKRHVPAGVNTILAALNGFFRYMDWLDCTVRSLHIQRRVFSDPETELSREEYFRLVRAAQEKKDDRLALLLQLLASTGIRVSEIRYVTAEALANNRVEICLKGKIRTILLPGKLRQKLQKYQRQQKIRSGPIFRTRTGRAIDRREVWAQMKQLCQAAGVNAGKVFPHNLRHLFARSFYQERKDIVKLADVLGHSNIETTRIYLLSSGQEHQQVLDNLRLIC